MMQRSENSPEYIMSRPDLTETSCILWIVTLLQHVIVSHIVYIYVTWWFIDIIMDQASHHQYV